MSEALDGYRRVEDRGSVGLIRDGYIHELQTALLHHEDLEVLSDAGRGTVKQCRAGDGRAVVREYRRGGLVRHFLKKYYVLDNRPWRELQVWDFVYRAGLSVPKPLGAVWKKVGPFYSGAFASEYIVSQHLEDWIKSNPEENMRDQTLHRVGEQFKAMHDLGILHADLQVRNVLIDSSNQAYLIDFDNAQIVETVSPEQADANLERFLRSLLKRQVPLPRIVPVMIGYGKDSDEAETWVRA